MLWCLSYTSVIHHQYSQSVNCSGVVHGVGGEKNGGDLMCWQVCLYLLISAIIRHVYVCVPPLLSHSNNTDVGVLQHMINDYYPDYWGDGDVLVRWLWFRQDFKKKKEKQPFHSLYIFQVSLFLPFFLKQPHIYEFMVVWCLALVPKGSGLKSTSYSTRV